MDNIVEYLIKSGLALIVFYLFYWLLMRKSTHFGLNRLTLATSLIASLVLPLFKIDFTPEVVAANIPVMSIDFKDVVQIVSKPDPAWGIREIVLLIYFTGLAITLFRLIYQSIYIHVISRMSRTITKGKHTIVLVDKDITPFAYFSKIFIPASKVEESSFESILAHEKSHLRQYHFLDLFLIEMVTIIQWFNPIVWLYERSLKEVHEYMADDEVLKQGVSKGKYQALLVNQALGGPVFTISHQFNQSLILKRIVMMTKMKSPQMAKIKVLLFIPLTAIVLMAFSNPEPIVNPVVEKVEALTQQISNSKLASVNLISGLGINTSKGKITVEGKVLDNATSNPLEGVNVIVKGTTKGTISDAKGNFTIKVDGSKAELIFSYVGYATIAKEFSTSGAVEIKMQRAAIEVDEIVIKNTSKDIEIKPAPYVVVDGIPAEGPVLESMDPNTIESVNVLKGQSAVALYGDKGKNGVIMIVTKKASALRAKASEASKGDVSAVFTVVEEMPSFPGGSEELTRFLANNLKMPGEGIEGTVYASFMVNEDGSVSGIKILRGLGKSYDDEVIRVIKMMPKWIPGQQNGKKVTTLMNIPVKFAK